MSARASLRLWIGLLGCACLLAAVGVAPPAAAATSVAPAADAVPAAEDLRPRACAFPPTDALIAAELLRQVSESLARVEDMGPDPDLGLEAGTLLVPLLREMLGPPACTSPGGGQIIAQDAAVWSRTGKPAPLVDREIP